MVNGEYKTVEAKVSVNGSIANDDVYLSVRVREPYVEQAIKDINKLGFACKKMELA